MFKLSPRCCTGSAPGLRSGFNPMRQITEGISGVAGVVMQRRRLKALALFVPLAPVLLQQFHSVSGAGFGRTSNVQGVDGRR